MKLKKNTKTFQACFQTRPCLKLGFRVLTGSIFLNQNDVVLIKKQKSTGCNRVFDRVLPGHKEFFLSLFFLQPSPVSAPDWSGQLPDQVQNYTLQ